MRAIRRIFGERMLQMSMQSDILQESFINTMPAWVNMLLLSSSGPIKTPVGACATAAESVDIAVETIIAGKAKVSAFIFSIPVTITCSLRKIAVLTIHQYL